MKTVEEIKDREIRTLFRGEYVEVCSAENTAAIIKHASKSAIGYTCSRNDDSLKELLRGLNALGYKTKIRYAEQRRVSKFLNSLVADITVLKEDDAWESYVASDETIPLCDYHIEACTHDSIRLEDEWN